MTSSFKRAHDLQESAAGEGFDWPDLTGVLNKVSEEFDELREALRSESNNLAIQEELGDFLFVIVNLARRLGVTPEQALASACEKFERRYGHIRARLAERGQQPSQVNLETLEALWQEAKQLENGQGLP